MDFNKQIDFTSITEKKWTQSQFFKIFCYIMFGGICLFLLSLLFLGLDRWQYLFFIRTVPCDSFMDFFHLVFRAQSDNIYAVWPKADYSALCYLVFKLFSQVIPINILNTSATAVKNSIYGITVLAVFLGTFSLSFFWLLFKNKSGPLKEKLLFCFFIFFSAPFLFSLERGNIIFVALFFTTFFVFYYDSPKRYLRELSLFFLACAVAIKIYPAAIGILLLKDKRYKDILRLGIYTICLFVLPFFYYNGIADIKQFVNNISRNSGKYTHLGYGYSVNMATTLKMIVYAVTQQEYSLLNKVFKYAAYFMLLPGAAAAYFTNKKWKTVAIACLLMVLVPVFSWTYTLLFLIPPLVLFLNDKEEKTFKDLIYLTLFCIIFMLNISIEMPILMPVIYPILVDNFCARLACFVMFIMLCNDGIKDFIRGNYGF